MSVKTKFDWIRCSELWSKPCLQRQFRRLQSPTVRTREQAIQPQPPLHEGRHHQLGSLTASGGQGSVRMVLACLAGFGDAMPQQDQVSRVQAGHATGSR